jgi:hypothetical protein
MSLTSVTDPQCQVAAASARLIVATTTSTMGQEADFVKGYSMPAIGHRNVTVPPRVSAGVE